MDASLQGDTGDVLLDGAPYRIAIPAGWNGTLLLDLDFVGMSGAPPGPAHQWLLGRGYAVAGTARVMNTVSASVWAHRLLQVLHVARKTYGRPARVIAYGQSGGGATARAFAQEMPHAIDGAVVMATPGSGQVSLLNQALDATVAAKALLAPGDDELVLTGLPARRARLEAAWRRVLSAAQQTSEGRARIALAAALAQLPDWGVDPDASGPPDPGDVPAVQEGFAATSSPGRSFTWPRPGIRCRRCPTRGRWRPPPAPPAPQSRSACFTCRLPATACSRSRRSRRRWRR